MSEHILLWTPRSKARPRSHVINGKAITYTPRQTLDAERALAAQWVGKPLEGPLSVHLFLSDVDVQVVIHEGHEIQGRKLRGDIDNYAKLVMDSLNGVAWVDDSQLVELFVRKL
jgi:crossover junction endodeoxyribonuclease RusA